MSKTKLMTGVTVKAHPSLLDLTLPEGAIPVDANVVLPEAATDVEIAIIDQGSTLKEISTIEKEIDRSLIVKDTLSGVKEIIESTVDDGGLKENTAKLVEIATQKSEQYVPKELEDEVKILPSVENYVFIRERSINTKIAIETLSERISKIWQWLMDKLKQLAKSFMMLYKKNTLLLDLLERRLKRTQHRLDSTQANNPVRMMENPYLVSALSINGAFPTDIVSHLNHYANVVKVMSEWKNQYEVKDLVGKFKQIANGAGNIKDFVNHVMQPPVGFTPNVELSQEDLKVTESVALLGNRKLIFTSLTPEWTEETLKDTISSVGMRLEFIEPTRKPDSKIRIVSIRDQKKLLALCQNIIDEIRKYKDDIPEISRQFEDLVRFSTTQINTISNGGNTAIIEQIAFQMPKFMSKPMPKFFDYSASVVRNIIRYVDLSLQPTQKENE